MELWRYSDTCSPQLSHCALWRNGLLEFNDSTVSIKLFFKLFNFEIIFIYFSGEIQKESCPWCHGTWEGQKEICGS